MDAIESYNKAININPNYVHSWYNLGYTYHGMNKLEKALDAYMKAIRLERNDEVLWNNTGNALYNLGRYEESIPFFIKAVGANPDYEIAWNNIGNALDKMKKHRESIPYHNKSIEIRSDFDYALYAKGYAIAKLGDLDEGADLITISLELNPHYDHSWFAKGDVLEKLGDWTGAMECYGKSIKLNPFFSEAWAAKGKILEKHGHLREAEHCYRKAEEADSKIIEENRGPHDTYNLSGHLLESLGRTDEAIERYRHEVEQEPFYYRAWLSLTRLLYRRGRYNELVETIGSARGEITLKDDLLIMLAKGYLMTENREKALEIILDADLDFEEEDILEEKARLLIGIDMLPDAGDILSRLLERGECGPNCKYLAASLIYKCKEPEKLPENISELNPEKLLRQSVKDEPRKAMFWLLMGEIKLENGDRRGAKKAFETQIGIDGNLKEAEDQLRKL